MNIYHCVESYHPAIGGMQEVVKQLSERLVVLGHEVIVITRKHIDRSYEELNGVKIKEFDIQGNPQEINSKESQAYVDFLLSLNCDIVTFFAAQQWATNLALPILKNIKAKKISVPTGYSGLYWPEFNEYFEKMKLWIHDYDMNVYLSNDYRDINFARENDVDESKIVLIPNGAAADEFMADDAINIRKELNIPENHFLLLLVGSYTGWKGHKEAVEIFFHSKLKKATLLMIGNNCEYFKRQYIKDPIFGLKVLLNKILLKKRFIFKSLRRIETVSAYKSADLFLFPSNVECSPIVLFECAASGLPFLSSDVGNSVEIAKWTKGGKIMPTVKDNMGFSHVNIKYSAQMLNEIYLNEMERQRMSKESFAEWKENFSWEVIAKKYEMLYSKLLR